MMRNSFRMIRGTGRCGGFTMIEVLIAAVVMVLATSAAMSAFVFSLRSNRAQQTQMMLARDTLNLQRTIKAYATSASRIIENGGRTVRIIQPDGIESQLRFRDGDGSANTPLDNTLVWDPNVNTNGDERTVVTGLGELADTANPNVKLPIFSQPNGVSSLRVRFRLGDQSTNRHSVENSKTGVGFQSFVFDSVFAARNSGI